MRLYQNAHRPTAMREEDHPPEFLTDGITIEAFKVNGQDDAVHPRLRSRVETLKIVPLPQPIPPGGQATFEIGWHYELADTRRRKASIDPDHVLHRLLLPAHRAHQRRRGRRCPGPLPGWDSEEFTYRSGRELHNDFADFTVTVTVPKDFLVWATGELQNPDEVLQPDAAKQYADSLTRDEIITIATPADLAAGADHRPDRHRHLAVEGPEHHGLRARRERPLRLGCGQRRR